MPGAATTEMGVREAGPGSGGWPPRLHPRAPLSALKQPPPRSPGRERAGEALLRGLRRRLCLPAAAGTRANAPLATSCSEGKSGGQRAVPGCCATRAEVRPPRQEGGRSRAATPGRALGGPGGHPAFQASPALPPHCPGLPRPSHPARSLRLPSSEATLRGDRYHHSPGRSALLPRAARLGPCPGSQDPVTR